MNLFHVKISEDYYETEGYPEEDEYMVVANNKEEALDAVKKKFLELGDEDDWERYTERMIVKWNFVYTGKETEPFVYMGVEDEC